MDEQRLHSHLKDLSPSKCWVIGAAIFQEPESENRSILLLERASHETTFPNAWELPGGHIEETDKAITHAVKRETSEEISLNVAKIIGEVEPMAWESKKQSNVRLNYVVIVQPRDIIKLSPKEHSDWRWVKLEELGLLYITLAMKKVVQDAFTFTVSSA
ncbi:uncharacterized protein PFLUO_LOCUS8203 [Penicillium psychrofluorescens]|uniref:uncharacterized protein n=1 Tax=Penicillium psychrofluorescens TaxID=3158075 RepID=UPI003CCE0A72